MHAWRRKPGWAALLAVLLYGLAPVLAAFAPAQAALPPAQCTTTPVEKHVCACKPDPHALTACCCNHGETGDGCKMKSAPCQSDPVDPAAPLWTAANPLPEPAARFLFSIPAKGEGSRGDSRPAVLPGASRLLTPPPQAPRLA